MFGVGVDSRVEAMLFGLVEVGGGFFYIRGWDLAEVVDLVIGVGLCM